LVRGADDNDRKTRISVYSDAYYLRLRDVLREDFPKVTALLGDRFDEVVRGYLETFPSEQPSVRHLGRALAEFLQSREDIPKCLADLAELEWTRVEVFDAPDRRSCLHSPQRLAVSVLLDNPRNPNSARSISRASGLVR
jgi:hypothetical protein